MTFSCHAILATLVSFDTTSRRSNLGLIEWVAAYLERLGIPSQLTFSECKAKANLLATIGPSVPGGVCLHGHSDVVPVDGQVWASKPFELTERNGLLYGRGTCDMKGWIACCLAAAAQFRGLRLRVPVQIAISFDEEVGCFGAPLLIESLGRTAVMPRVVVVGEPTSMQPIVAHKGVLALDTSFWGKEAHSSEPELGISALSAAAELALVIDRANREWSSFPHTIACSPAGPTVHAGTLTAGVARNVVPGHARLQWELRYRPGDDLHALRREVLRRAEADIRARLGERWGQLRVETRETAHVPAFDGRADEAAQVLLRECGIAAPAAAVAYGTEAGQYAAAGMSVVVCGPGSIKQAHQPDEFVSAQQLERCCQFLSKVGDWAC